ncbi:glycoside hydrolase family 2 protein [Dinghuibacter silviterrae]|uniref:Beta-glucuronidase n=1 Tax=Dinghuibacter silviterrae TaxID=1539049 RepID=A0A4R8DEL3_9BACT|nr:glycoside hydrolase family 2 TIM barrel-domain containing protein [Dinghuibacter silviterrae]TDW95827.1 beta-glucuronidase [Dinghuibacter silviterrae]
MIRIACALTFVMGLVARVFAQTDLITDIPSRQTVSLNGRWQYIIDPYETGFLDYRYKEMARSDRNAYWNSDVPSSKTDKIEFGYTDKYSLMVPGDWNHQDPKFEYYEGTVWYKKSFDFVRRHPGDRIFLYFGAVNYRADVYLNGVKLGMHKGGFTPFNFEIPDSLLRRAGNYLVVRVDNRRYPDEVPTVNTDWWNYGGITREVRLVEVPSSFIRDFFLQAASATALSGSIRLSGSSLPSSVVVGIPELGIRQTFPVTGDSVGIAFSVPGLQLWSPSSPKRYTVVVTAGADKVTDKIGFRTIEARGGQVLLNGKPIFMRGICIHEEIPQEGRRAYSARDAAQLLGWARELGCNMVRLAHYPHDETMTRLADSLGILVWSEIPVYWTIDFGNPAVFDKANAQLREMITRDHNRASVIIWSVGNETPVNTTRTDFMRRLIASARSLDSTRLISAALEVNYGSSATSKRVVDDPLGQYVDLVAFNEYLGWYGGLPSACRTANWSTIYDKPLFISETGAEALGGYHADSLTRWSEEYQAWYYREQVAMLQRMPANFVGLSPWVLADFRSPKRNNPLYQEGWNNKGVMSHKGVRKEAWEVLKKYYQAK